jgi:hypothetical protein
MSKDKPLGEGCKQKADKISRRGVSPNVLRQRD